MKKLLLTLVAALCATMSFAQTNLLSNPGFEDGVETGWTPTAYAGAKNATVSESTDAHSGSKAALVAGSTKNVRLAASDLQLKAGTYTFSAYVKAATADGATARLGYVVITDGKAGSYNYSYNQNGLNNADTLTTEWKQLTYSFTLSETSTVNILVMNSKNLGKDLVVDDASLTTTDGGIDQGGDEPTPTPEGAITVAEAQAAEAGTEVTVQGTVYAVGASSFVVGDATGYIFHYGAADVKVGDVVTVSGAISSYGGFNQFKSATVNVVAAGTATYPTVTVMDGAAMDAWIASPAIQYVQYTGKLAISGNYYNVTVDGATTAVGSIIKPNSDLAAKMSNGSTYTFIGFAMYLSGSKYVNTIITDVKAEGEVVVLNDISNTLETAYTVSEAVKLIDDEKSDLSKSVYVKGKISQMPDGAISTSYGNATFYISEDGSADSQQFEIYRGYWFNGDKFTAEDQLKLGDEVIYYGTLTKYNTTYETNSGAKLVSLNGSTDAIKSVAADTKQAAIYNLAGQRVSKAQKGIFIIGGKKVLK